MRFRDRVQNAIKAWRFGAVDNYMSLDAKFRALADTKTPVNELVQASTAVYSAIDLRSSTLASIPIRLLLDTGDGYEAVGQHPVLDLLKYVNPYWTFERLLQAIEMSMCVFGESFVVIERDNRGNPAELWFVPSNKITMLERRSADEYVPGWKVEVGVGNYIEYVADDVIWIRGVMDPTNEFRSLSPLRAARIAIESSIDAMVSNQSILRNGLNPGGILSPREGGMSLTREQRESIEEQLNLRMRGVDKAHKLAVFSHPMDLQTPQLTPADAQFLELLSFSVIDVCRVFKVPPTKLMDFSTATYSNVEQADKAFFSDCIIPEARRIASEFTEQLLKSYEPGLRLEFDFTRIPALQEDQTEIVNQMQILVSMGVPLETVLAHYKPELLQ
jgi:HK97 family phage portal protein